MKRSTKNVIIAAGLTATFAALAGAYVATAKKLMDIALDRETPKHSERGKKLITGSDKLSEISGVLLESAAELEKNEMETVNIEAGDGVKLIGHFYCPEKPERVILAMHGWRSGWSQDFGGIAPFWMDNNCAVLFAEQRAQGESGGEYMGFGLLERHDCQKWAEWIDEKTAGRLPIYLCGISMGASTVLMAAGLSLPDSVHGIIADCGFTSPNAIWKHVAESNLRIPYGLYSALTNDLCRRKIQVASDSYCTTEALKECKVPVLFIHGTDDKFVPVEMTFENYKACVSEKRLFVVPGAEHGMSYLVDKKGYESEVLEFWKDFD